jgi:DNA helicase II / ATP-dependent DNA helicase PcrA
MARGFDLSKLNPQQRAAVTAVRGPVLILAGAGTGKTRTITARIAHMLEQGIPASQVLAVTFTNKAATEMRERVKGMVPKGSAGKLLICTFHSLCVRILRGSIDKLGFKRNFSIHTASEQTSMIKRILVRRVGREEKIEPAGIVARISASKNRNRPFTEEDDPLVRAVASDYESEKRAINAVDFDDLLVFAVEVLREHPEVRAKWREQFRYLMVDEFQDTNRLQLDLLRLLAGPERNVCVVGDDDQSIYGWRGAEIENILGFERWFENPKVIRLEENYRSTTPILHTANSLIRHNLNRREKKLWSGIPGADPVRLAALPGDAAEAEFVINEIQVAGFAEKRSWDDFAVLFRTNKQSRPFEEQLRARKIPYRMIGGQSFFDRREIKDLLAYLTALVHPEDDIHLLRILNTPPRGISNATAATAVERSQELGLPVWATLAHERFRSALGGRAREAVGGFFELIARNSALARDDPAGAARALLAEIDYDDYVRRTSKTPEEARTRIEALGSVIEDLRRHHLEHRDEGLQGFLDAVALAGDREDSGNDLEKQSGVSLITLHAAKGLEFPVVYLTGVEDGLMPHKRSLEEGTRDEERRLFYVGITRAMRQLTMTFCYTRRKWGEDSPCMPSPFLRELDPQFIEEIDIEAMLNQPASEEDRAACIDQLRAMLEDVEGFEVR